MSSTFSERGCFGKERTETNDLGIMAWIDGAELSLRNDMRILLSFVFEGSYISHLESLCEEAYYETLANEMEEMVCEELRLEASYEEAYRETLAKEQDELTREMELEALYEEAYDDFLAEQCKKSTE